jgi:hypothetical protein
MSKADGNGGGRTPHVTGRPFEGISAPKSDAFAVGKKNSPSPNRRPFERIPAPKSDVFVVGMKKLPPTNLLSQTEVFFLYIHVFTIQGLVKLRAGITSGHVSG